MSSIIKGAAYTVFGTLVFAGSRKQIGSAVRYIGAHGPLWNTAKVAEATLKDDFKPRALQEDVESLTEKAPKKSVFDRAEATMDSGDFLETFEEMYVPQSPGGSGGKKVLPTKKFESTKEIISKHSEQQGKPLLEWYELAKQEGIGNAIANFFNKKVAESGPGKLICDFTDNLGAMVISWFSGRE